MAKNIEREGRKEKRRTPTHQVVVMATDCKGNFD